MLWIDEQFINRISVRLSYFKKVKQNLYNCRCPICGDSKTQTWKARGYFYVHKNAQVYNYACHNCGASISLSSFLKLIDNSIFDEYILERFKQTPNKPHTLVVERTQKPLAKAGLSKLMSISQMSDTHPAVQYVTKRKIPTKYWSELFYASKYLSFIAGIEKTTFNADKEHPRLVIPFYDTHGNVTRLSGRAFGKEAPKYRYTIINDEASRIYGIDRVDKNKTVFITEGPLDSLFLDNAVAVGSADYMIPELELYKNRVYVPDNEPRNKSVMTQLSKVVECGYPTVLWDRDYGKDINEMVERGIEIDEIKRIIQRCTFSGFELSLRFKQWLK